MRGGDRRPAGGVGLCAERPAPAAPHPRRGQGAGPQEQRPAAHGARREAKAWREGFFLPCTFWLVDNLALSGRQEEARALFERLLSLRNDVGLLAEEYDPAARRQLGNFPQAFTHVSLVNSAWTLGAVRG